jgi:hypothetical protein
MFSATFEDARLMIPRSEKTSDLSENDNGKLGNRSRKRSRFQSEASSDDEEENNRAVSKLPRPPSPPPPSSSIEFDSDLDPSLLSINPDGGYTISLPTTPTTSSTKPAQTSSAQLSRTCDTDLWTLAGTES